MQNRDRLDASRSLFCARHQFASYPAIFMNA